MRREDTRRPLPRHFSSLKRSRVHFLELEPVLGDYGGNLKNAPTVEIKPVTSRSLGGHYIHYTTAAYLLISNLWRRYRPNHITPEWLLTY
ncbi:hypothetical protein DPMN_113788 [Dreissena polymorpha]|uniref:Uncharacterized protein n=1 Tax=Dreissena polymorpha TaxID=45954 RepID=A0A9D4KJN8_DREPO|nr:hypothetical protein DPMN_113788 [Dreissena polymorpha]